MRYGVIPFHTVLSYTYVKARTLHNSSTFLAEILSSHLWRFFLEIKTSSKSHLLLGYVHDLATNEQLRNDRTSEA